MPPASGRSPMYMFASAALVVATLWAARDLLLPVALAVLLAFTLAPVVALLARLRLGRVISVILVTAGVGTVLAMLGMFVVAEVSDVASTVQNYRGNLETKVVQLLEGWNVPRDDIRRAARQLSQLSQLSERFVGALGVVAGALMPILGTTAVVSVLTIFMLVYREDFRDRIIRLCGVENVTATTDALDDAASKVSRYLLMWVAANAIHGTMVATVLSLLGVPSPLLWGVLSGMFRFVPYVGPVVADLLPLALVSVTAPGWVLPLQVFASLMVVELLSNNVVETLLYSRGTGVSPPAVVVAALFWGWVWGPAGLLLSTPLTVCLLVLGRHISQLEFLAVILGDAPVLETRVKLYQRLLASDLEETHQIIDARLKSHARARVFDEDLLGAIRFAHDEYERDAIDDQKLDLVLDGVEALIEKIEAAAKEAPAKEPPLDETPFTPPPASARVNAVCVPAYSRTDKVAGSLLRITVARRGIDITVLPETVSPADVEAVLEKFSPNILFVIAVGAATPRRDRELDTMMEGASKRALVAAGRFGRTEDGEPSRLGRAERWVDVGWRSLVDAERYMQRYRTLKRVDQSARNDERAAATG